MSVVDLETQADAFLREWVRSMKEGDVAAAGRLRADHYVLTIPGVYTFDRAAELQMLGSPAYRLDLAALVGSEPPQRDGDAVHLHADIRLSGDYAGSIHDILYRYSFRCVESEGALVAQAAQADEVEDYYEPEVVAPPARVRLRAALGSLARRVRRVREKRPAAFRFQDLAYLPYAPGGDYVLEPHAPATAPEDELPIPPQELWLGYDYMSHGAEHVRTMLDIAARSGFAPRDGDRILDLGCGAGRMIRHLRHLAQRCEIWGADISAPHIVWCKHHLSPPFRFATTTKVPHLPFPDGYFSFIYCGSLFTHIDDLADAWLLELRRVLRPGGRLYVTIHDEETIRLFGTRGYRRAAVVRWITSRPTFETASGSEFGMFTIGRDNQSQVFYRRSYFERMTRAAFETLSVTGEAYHYQTAFLLTPLSAASKVEAETPATTP